MKYKRISGLHDKIRLQQLFMNTGLHCAQEKIMILAACCLQFCAAMASVSVSRNATSFALCS